MGRPERLQESLVSLVAGHSSLPHAIHMAGAFLHPSLPRRFGPPLHSVYRAAKELSGLSGSRLSDESYQRHGLHRGHALYLMNSCTSEILPKDLPFDTLLDPLRPKHVTSLTTRRRHFPRHLVSANSKTHGFVVGTGGVSFKKASNTYPGQYITIFIRRLCI